ncbi:DNA-binding transcriptional regulator CsgD [Citrobacter freundii]|nr:DNA-binding transcriptional regulator CsgD [Citrobacter freundii]
MLNMDSKIILISNQSIQTQLLLDYLNKQSDILVDFVNISRPDMSYIVEGSIILYDIQASSRKLKKSGQNYSMIAHLICAFILLTACDRSHSMKICYGRTLSRSYQIIALQNIC